MCIRDSFTTAAIDPETARRELVDAAAGACASFEGWVRNFNDGHEVKPVSYTHLLASARRAVLDTGG